MPFVDLMLIGLRVLLLGMLVILWTEFSHASSDSKLVALDTSSNNLDLVLYQKAEDALKKNQNRQFEQLVSDLKNHPLVEYLHRDWLIKQLSLSSDKANLGNEIQAFLKRNHNQVVSRKLRSYWLNYLSDTHQHQQFSQYYLPQRSVKLRCQHLWIQLRNGQPLADLSPKITKLWLTGQSLPKQCDLLIALWKQKGELTESLIWQRMQLAATNNQFQLVRYLSRMLSDKAKPAGRWLEQISRNPRRLKQKPPRQLNPGYAQTIIFTGLKKLAWINPEEAIKLWKQYHSQLNLSFEQKTQLQRSIGLSLAINDSPKAKDWLQSVETPQDNSVKQWLLSSKLSRSDWSAIHQLTLKNAQLDASDKWLFWNAISAENLGNKTLAERQLAAIADNRSYYGFLAAASLAKPLQLNHVEATVTAKEINQLNEHIGAKRARGLLMLGRYGEARSEWNQLIKTLPKTSYIIAAHLANRWQWDHQSILAFAKSKSLNDIEKRFPLYKIDNYKTATKHHQIPLSWAYAITRQESAFKKDATSSAGAQGLMQLKPSTAKHVARKKLKGSVIATLSSPAIARKKLLHQPELNINLGVAHLRQMLDYYDGNPVLATAAYNAGSTRVDSWLKNNDISDSITWIEQIPFKETREYVKNVLTYQVIYAELTEERDHFISNINHITIPTYNKSNLQVSTR